MDVKEVKNKYVELNESNFYQFSIIQMIYL